MRSGQTMNSKNSPLLSEEVSGICNLITGLLQFWQVQTLSSDFLKKKLLVQRNTKINIKRNAVVTLPWRLRLQ